MQKYFRYFLIAFCSAVLIVVIRRFELAYMIGQISTKLYITLIGLVFLGVGLYLGWRMRNKKVIVKTVEVEKQNAPILNNTNLLTQRETDILSSIIAGMSNKEIATKHFVSENTVKKHINNIYSKLGATRRTQAIAKAKEYGILSENV